MTVFLILAGDFTGPGLNTATAQQVIHQELFNSD